MEVEHGLLVVTFAYVVTVVQNGTLKWPEINCVDEKFYVQCTIVWKRWYPCLKKRLCCVWKKMRRCCQYLNDCAGTSRCFLFDILLTTDWLLFNLLKLFLLFQFMFTLKWSHHQAACSISMTSLLKIWREVNSVYDCQESNMNNDPVSLVFLHYKKHQVETLNCLCLVFHQKA